MENTFEILAKIIEDVADIPKDEIKKDSSFIDDLDLSSLEVLSIVSKLEKELSVKINEDELLEIGTVEDMLEVIESKR
ncbi:acyl carrier protein [Pseudobutyrivibrio xylanivorans]|uniref:Acyl carrier protein n=1 Tax=Pseudobutyrivibrio xylanivorans TaxID=185007 RepID=A0A5P6VMJ4_PSEXY|nr:phosphopantetheine-binding protein [Pseudobutyrivibrio xylanivorans]QFJ53886.1 acyl carrier protein [Pseudobutyrivibrio xylanivorans]